jgi:LCP family protein required for cell wall assembly
MKVNFDQKSAVIYAFPPDLVVETPGLTEEYQIQTSRIQDIFTALVIADGESKTTDVNASQATAQAILDNFGIAADHYFTVKEDVVEEMVNIVGGIDVTLSQDFTMPDYSTYEGLVLKAGNQHLDGEMVHAITTFRTSAEDEIYRLANQNVVLAGMWKKLLDPAVYVKIPQLYTSYINNITTDLSLEQFAALSCLSRLIPAENITVDTPSIEQLIVKEDGSTYMKNPDQLVSEIQALFSTP